MNKSAAVKNKGKSTRTSVIRTSPGEASSRLARRAGPHAPHGRHQGRGQEGKVKAEPELCAPRAPRPSPRLSHRFPPSGLRRSLLSSYTLRPESRSSGHAAPPYSLGAYTQKPGRADDNGAETGKLPRPIGQPRTERRKSPRTGRAAKGQLGAALVKPGKPQKGPGRQRSSAAF